MPRAKRPLDTEDAEGRKRPRIHDADTLREYFDAADFPSLDLEQLVEDEVYTPERLLAVPPAAWGAQYRVADAAERGRLLERLRADFGPNGAAASSTSSTPTPEAGPAAAAEPARDLRRRSVAAPSPPVQEPPAELPPVAAPTPAFPFAFPWPSAHDTPRWVARGLTLFVALWVLLLGLPATWLRHVGPLHLLDAACSGWARPLCLRVPGPLAAVLLASFGRTAAFGICAGATVAYVGALAALGTLARYPRPPATAMAVGLGLVWAALVDGGGVASWQLQAAAALCMVPLVL